MGFGEFDEQALFSQRGPFRQKSGFENAAERLYQEFWKAVLWNFIWGQSFHVHGRFAWSWRIWANVGRKIARWPSLARISLPAAPRPGWGPEPQRRRNEIQPAF